MSAPGLKRWFWPTSLYLLFPNAHHEGTRQLAGVIGKRCVIRGAFFAKQGHFPGIRAFLDQRVVAGIVMIEFRIDRGFSFFRAQGRVLPNEIMAIISEDSAFLSGHRALQLLAHTMGRGGA